MRLPAPTMSRDGRKRITLNLALRIDAENLAMLLGAALGFDGADEDEVAEEAGELAAELASLTASRFMDLIRGRIITHGSEPMDVPEKVREACEAVVYKFLPM